MNKQYELIIFDLDNTIWDFGAAESVSIIEALKKFDIAHNTNKTIKTYKKINHQLWKDFEQGRIDVKDLKTERFKQLFNHFDFPEIDFLAFSETYLEQLQSSTFFVENALDVLEYANKKYTVCAMTNGFSQIQRKRLKQSNIENHFEVIAISEEIGYKKPQPEIFEWLFDQLDNPIKEKTLIIGDNLSSDILGGHNFGIDTCWFTYYKQKRSGIRPTYTVGTHKELLKII